MPKFDFFPHFIWPPVTFPFLFFSTNNVCVCISHFLYLFDSLSHNFPIVSNTVDANIDVCISLWYRDLDSFVYIPGNGLVRSYNSSTFKFFEKLPG